MESAERFRQTEIQHGLKSLSHYKMTHKTHLDVASKGVVAVELARVSIAGVFHLSIDENVSGEQSHFSAHVDSIYNLSNVVILRFPCAQKTQRFMLQ